MGNSKTSLSSTLKAIFGSILIALTTFGCRQSPESRLVGTWEWKSCDDAGDITYRKDRTFISREWALSHTQQPPVIFDSGDWQVRSGQIVLNFKGDSRPPEARHVVVSFILFGEDVLVIRGPNRLVRTFERVQ
jgi:hypothetical protein